MCFQTHSGNKKIFSRVWPVEWLGVILAPPYGNVEDIELRMFLHLYLLQSIRFGIIKCINIFLWVSCHFEF